MELLAGGGGEDTEGHRDRQTARWGVAYGEAQVFGDDEIGTTLGTRTGSGLTCDLVCTRCPLKAGASNATVAPPDQRTELSMAEMRWGFIGASIWASRYLIPAVHAAPDAQASAIYSTSAERGAQFVRDSKLERSYATLEELLADPTIDAVYISTTNDLHASQTIAAAKAGKHVLCEKPMAITLEDAIAMQTACLDAGVILAIDHHLRGAATIQAMRQSLASGAIGELVAARVFHAFSLPEPMRTWRVKRPETGAGVILDITVHDADTIRYLLDDEIAEVTAAVASQGLGQGSIEDSVMGVMRMLSGALVSFHDAFTVPHAGTGIELHGTSGSVIGRDVLSPEPIGEVVLKRGATVRPVAVAGPWRLYERVVNDFHAAIRGTGQPLASAEDGIASLAVAIAAAESARQGTPIRPASDGRPTRPTR